MIILVMMMIMMQNFAQARTDFDCCCSEMAPPHLRGRFNQLYQIILTLFILVAQVLNLIINLTGAVRWGWRLSLGFAFVPSSVLFLGGIFLPDSPNSLPERGFPEQVLSQTQAKQTKTVA
jgi:MFS family permease